MQQESEPIIRSRDGGFNGAGDQDKPAINPVQSFALHPPSRASGRNPFIATGHYDAASGWDRVRAHDGPGSGIAGESAIAAERLAEKGPVPFALVERSPQAVLEPVLATGERQRIGNERGHRDLADRAGRLTGMIHLPAGVGPFATDTSASLKGCSMMVEYRPSPCM